MIAMKVIKRNVRDIIKGMSKDEDRYKRDKRR